MSNRCNLISSITKLSRDGKLSRSRELPRLKKIVRRRRGFLIPWQRTKLRIKGRLSTSSRMDHTFSCHKETTNRAKDILSLLAFRLSKGTE